MLSKVGLQRIKSKFSSLLASLLPLTYTKSYDTLLPVGKILIFDECRLPDLVNKRKLP